MGAKMRQRTLAVMIQVPQEDGDSAWHWADDLEHSPAGEEPVHSEADLRRVMLVYGAVVAQMLSRFGPSRFRLLGVGAESRRTLAVYYLRWVGDRGRYWPEAEPWCIWDAAA